ncbi:hypothetical protein D3C79_915440 [compost metagenome]
MQVDAHARQNGQAHLWLVFQGIAVMGAIDADQHAVLERRGRHRVTARLAEQQRFGKGLARLDDLHQMFLALGAEPVQLDLATDQQEEALGRVALVHERVMAAQAPEHGQATDGFENVVRQLAEQVMTT